VALEEPGRRGSRSGRQRRVTSTAVPQLVRLDRHDDGVAVVTLDNPKVNALSSALLNQLRDVARGLTDDPPRAVLVTGGPKVFAAGADIGEFGGPDEARTVGTAFLEALEAVAAIPRPTIAAIGGYALGGGCELALACDLRIASERARLGQPEILLGIIPGGGGTQRLARLVGPSRAKELIFSGRQVGAEEALRLRGRGPGVGGRAGRRSRRRGRPGQAGDRRGPRPRPRRRAAARAGPLRGVVPHRGQPHRRRVVPRARPGQGHLHGALSHPHPGPWTL
jgi:hypothetical protein